jgi:uncharacterized phage protein (TIGR02216 family)
MDPRFRGDERRGRIRVSDKFPWRAVMGFGLGRLRLSPREFWAATLRELSAAAEAIGGVRGAPIERAAFDELIKRFPDRT